MAKRILLITLIFVSMNLFAESFNVVTPDTPENDKSLKRTIKTLVIQSIESQGHSVSNSSKSKMKTSLLKLGSSYIMTMRKVTKSGVVARKMKMKELDDLDTVIERLVKATLSGSTVKKTLEVGKVTQQEKERSNEKIQVTRQWLFGLGPAWLTGLGDTSSYSFVLGYIWGLDHNFDLSIRYAFSKAEGSAPADFRKFTFGGSYFFSKAIHAPYVIVDLGYGGAENSNKKDGSGWVVGLGGGIKFFRASSVNFGIEAMYSTLFEKVEGKAPGEMSIKIIAYF